MRVGEILTAIQIPYPPKRFGAAYSRFSLREANACAVAGVAASLLLDRGDKVIAARIVLGAVAPTPLLIESAAASLVGQSLDEESIQGAAHAAMTAASPISDIRASGDYRRELIGVLTSRALRQARSRASGAES
jgi:carbon-monoxide dehydrogenase medium subunit